MLPQTLILHEIFCETLATGSKTIDPKINPPKSSNREIPFQVNA